MRNDRVDVPISPLPGLELPRVRVPSSFSPTTAGSPVDVNPHTSRESTA
jgi:hypothetical protein